MGPKHMFMLICAVAVTVPLKLGLSPCRLQTVNLVEINWHIAVFDEAHKLKNDGSATYQTASMLQKVTSRLYGLSGTVMQVKTCSAITCY